MATLCDLWAALRTATTRPQGGGYRLQLADAKQTLRVYAGISERDGTPALFIELPAAMRPTDLARISTRSFDCELVDMPGLPTGHCAIVLHLKDEEFADLFAVLGEEIRTAVRAASTGEAACRSVLRCIERWRRFVERGQRALTDEEVRGLVGELVVLGRCINRHGSSTAIGAWRGPTGSLRDFELPDCSVEVKTYQSDTGASIRINDPQQLDVVVVRPVHLAVVRLAKTQARGVNLPDVVQRIRGMLASDRAGRDEFDSLLDQYGYMDAQASLYADRFVAGPLYLHKVVPAFPRIAAEQVPPGVVQVHFSVVLSALIPFRVEPDMVIGPAVRDIEIG